MANELSEQGYAGCEVRVTPQRTEIIIRATNTGDVIGDNGRRIRELTALIQKRFKFPRNGLICFAERVRNKGFSALTQAQAVKYRLLTGLTVRRAAYSCLKYIMDDSDRKNGAMGCEIIVSGKLRYVIFEPLFFFFLFFFFVCDFHSARVFFVLFFFTIYFFLSFVFCLLSFCLFESILNK